MHYEFHPSEAPDPADPDIHYGVAPEQITTELFELCEQFFGQASPMVHGELDQFLTEHGRPGGISWFIDALGITTLHRTARLTPQPPNHRDGIDDIGAAPGVYSLWL